MNQREEPPRFELREELAGDELAVCWRAFDRNLQREVVVQRLCGPALQGDTARRVLRAARALAGVRSDRILGVLEVGTDREGPFLLLDTARGESLAERVARFGPLEQELVRRVAGELCEALASVHRAGLVHGNLALEHVFLDPDVGARLSGFTLARRAPGAPSAITTIGQSDTMLQVAGENLGPYAPEAATGCTPDARSDLFALGCVLVEALTGLHPFSADHWPQAVDVGLLRRVRPDVDPRLAAIVEATLSTDPRQRPASAAELGRSLADLEGTVAATRRPGSGRRRVAAVAAAAGVLLVAGAWWGSRAVRGGPKGDDRGRLIQPEVGPRGYSEGYESSYALIVGIDRYADPAWPTLSHAVDDARALRDFLVHEERFPQENVTLLVGKRATRENITRHLWNLDGETVPVGENDRVLFFFAGHGQQKRAHVGRQERLGYLVPYDATENASSWILHEAILKATQTTPAKHFLLLLDCCFSGDALFTRGAAASAGFKSSTSELARQVMTAGRPGEQVGDALSSDPDHSPFTHFLLEGLRGGAGVPGRGFVSASQLGVFVKDRVLEATGARQTPSFGAIDGVGDFVFFRETPEEGR